MSRVITMRVVAEHAGVTQATVSMSLANSPNIPLATRERIRRIADELGYRPNPYISALMRTRRLNRSPADRPVLALVNCFGQADGWRNSAALTVRQMHEGAEARATDRGYSAQDFWLHQDDMSNDRFSTMLYARGIHGLLVGPLQEDARPPTLRWEHFAAVSLSVPLVASTIHTVCNDHYLSALRAVRECHALGYRRPGLAILRMHRNRFQGRWEAGVVMAGQLLEGLSPAPTLYLESWKNLEGLSPWLEGARPDVIITPGAELLYPVLTGLGWAAPQKVGLAGLASSAPNHPVSGVYQNGRMIGATAIDALIGILERNERGLPEQATTHMLEGIWNPGQTLRPQGAPDARPQAGRRTRKTK